MMLSKTSEYALRSLMYLALQATKEHKVGIKEISQELDLPMHFTGKILQDLVRKGLVASLKGPNGGFFLNHPASSITIMDVVKVVDGGEAFRRCGLGMNKCSDTHPCPLHEDFKVFRDGLARVFNIKTIHDLVQEVGTGHAFIKNLVEVS
jgi:Rrf2 family protein